MSPGEEGQNHPHTALAGCWAGRSALSWGKILKEEEDSSLMDGDSRRLQQQLSTSSSSSFPFSLRSLGRILAQMEPGGIGMLPAPAFPSPLKAGSYREELSSGLMDGEEMEEMEEMCCAGGLLLMTILNLA